RRARGESHQTNLPTPTAVAWSRKSAAAASAKGVLHCAWVRFGKKFLARLGRLGRALARPNALSDLVKSSTPPTKPAAFATVCRVLTLQPMRSNRQSHQLSACKIRPRSGILHPCQGTGASRPRVVLLQCRQSSWRSPGAIPVIGCKASRTRCRGSRSSTTRRLSQRLRETLPEFPLPLTMKIHWPAERCLGLVEDFRPPPNNNNASNGEVVESLASFWQSSSGRRLPNKNPARGSGRDCTHFPNLPSS